VKSGIIQRSNLHRLEKFKTRIPRPVQKEFDAMQQDIKEKEQIDEISIDERFNIIDGFTRDEILELEGITEIKYNQYKFEDTAEIFAFIESKNVKRRHLTEYLKFESAIPEYQKEIEQAEKRQKSGTLASVDAKGKATTKAAKKAGISTATFERSLIIKERANTDQIKKVREGKTGVKTLAIQLTNKDRNLPKEPLPKTTSDVILVDVPYGYDDKGGRASAETHYPTIPINELKEEFTNFSCAKNAIIFFWMSPSIQYSEVPIQYTNEHQEGCAVIVQTPVYKAILDAAGFKVKQEFVWNKKKIGVGSWNRNQHENLLVAIKGKMPVPLKLFPSIIEELRTIHSKKPNLWPMIQEMYPKRNYLELYARKKTLGVKTHGNQINQKNPSK